MKSPVLKYSATVFLKKLPGTKPRSLKFARPNGKLNRGLKWQILCTEPENYMEPAISFLGKFWFSLLDMSNVEIISRYLDAKKFVFENYIDEVDLAPHTDFLTR